MSNGNRIEPLDWLRGMCALSIMIYHLVGWLFFSLDSGTVLGRLGIYGVCVFFVLSGLSMAIVYNSYIKDVSTSVKFFAKRIFRIWPLFWVACFLVIVLAKLNGSAGFSTKVIFLNLTTLFGFIKPEANIPIGSWSIGNEMVYYALTPLLITVYNRKKLWGNLVFVLTVLISLFYSNFLLTPDLSLAKQWVVYINPLNSLYLYTAGVAIYYNFKDVKIHQKLNFTILLAALILFVLLPYNGDQIRIVTGTGRIIFSIICASIVFSTYKLEVSLPRFIEHPLEALGVATYSIYLLHPIVYSFVTAGFNRILKVQNHIVLFIAVTIFTIIFSLISYKYFETPFVVLGKKVTKSQTKGRAVFKN